MEKGKIRRRLRETAGARVFPPEKVQGPETVFIGGNRSGLVLGLASMGVAPGARVLGYSVRVSVIGLACEVNVRGKV